MRPTIGNLARPLTAAQSVRGLRIPPLRGVQNVRLAAGGRPGRSSLPRSRVEAVTAGGAHGEEDRLRGHGQRARGLRLGAAAPQEEGCAGTTRGTWTTCPASSRSWNPCRGPSSPSPGWRCCSTSTSSRRRRGTTRRPGRTSCAGSGRTSAKPASQAAHPHPSQGPEPRRLPDRRPAAGTARTAFSGTHIHFGSKKFPDWPAVMAYLRPRAVRSSLIRQRRSSGRRRHANGVWFRTAGEYILVCSRHVAAGMRRK